MALFHNPENLRGTCRKWLVTGGAGFIGSHIVEQLLDLGQDVVVLDNLAVGKRSTLSEVVAAAPFAARRRFRLVVGDIRDTAACRDAVEGVDHVLHHAALGSVPGSIENPGQVHDVNAAGFVSVLIAARDAGAKSVVYASSSAVYGDDPASEKTEHCLGGVLSPYAASKRCNELFAQAFTRCYGQPTVGLRYFNVYGPRQDPDGPYAAVIPRWLAALAGGTEVVVNGDGSTTRDFCCVRDVVQANLRAALAGPAAAGGVFNIGSGHRTTLTALLSELRSALTAAGVPCTSRITHGPFRAGDIRHSLADISSARTVLGFAPAYDLRAGLALAMPHYLQQTGWSTGRPAPVADRPVADRAMAQRAASGMPSPA